MQRASSWSWALLGVAWGLSACVSDGSGLSDRDPIGAIEPVAAAAEAAPAPSAREAWIVGSFGFLYSEDGLDPDAIDLDGVGSDGAACAHEDFEGGVDHQFLRFTERFESLQQGGIADSIISSAVKNGSMTILLTTTDEQVGVLVGRDAPITGNDGEVLPFGSFRVHEDAAYHSDLGPVSREGSVLTAGPADLRLKLVIQIVDADLPLRDARIRARIDDDGVMRGVLAGFWPSEDVVEILASTPAHLGALGYTLEEFTAALDELADGDPGPDGTCRGLSTAFRFEAHPAFIVP